MTTIERAANIVNRYMYETVRELDDTSAENLFYNIAGSEDLLDNEMKMAYYVVLSALHKNTLQVYTVNYSTVDCGDDDNYTDYDVIASSVEHAEQEFIEHYVASGGLEEDNIDIASIELRRQFEAELDAMINS
jgi:hypothetical protein